MNDWTLFWLGWICCGLVYTIIECYFKYKKKYNVEYKDNERETSKDGKQK